MDQTTANKGVTLASEVLQLRGEALLGVNRPQDAQKAFNGVLASRPESSDAKIGLARIALVGGHYKEAERLLGAVLNGAPDDAQALVLNGEMLLGKNEPKTAEEVFRKAVQDIRYGTLAKIGLTRALMAQEKLDQAREILDSLDERVNSPLVYRLRAFIAQKNNDPKKAKEQLMKP